MNQRMQKHRAVIDKEKNMPATPYYGTYCRFKTADKKAGSQLLGADNLVGDVFDVYFKQEGVETIAWMKNRFGADIGYFDADISRDLQLCQVKGWSLHAVLASVYFTDSPEPGEFWEKPPLSAMTRNMKPHSMRSPRNRRNDFAGRATRRAFGCRFGAEDHRFKRVLASRRPRA